MRGLVAEASKPCRQKFSDAEDYERQGRCRVDHLHKSIAGGKLARAGAFFPPHCYPFSPAGDAGLRAGAMMMMMMMMTPPPQAFGSSRRASRQKPISCHPAANCCTRSSTMAFGLSPGRTDRECGSTAVPSSPWSRASAGQPARVLRRRCRQGPGTRRCCRAGRSSILPALYSAKLRCQFRCPRSPAPD
jgi:hypothetical protein